MLTNLDDKNFGVDAFKTSAKELVSCLELYAKKSIDVLKKCEPIVNKITKDEVLKYIKSCRYSQDLLLKEKTDEEKIKEFEKNTWDGIDIFMEMYERYILI